MSTTAGTTPLTCVCVSYNAPPLNDAESLCTIRLLSAMAEAGVEVHLVTADWPVTLDPSITAEILHPAIRITRVPLVPSTPARRLAAFLRWGLHMPENTWITPAIRATRRVLRACPRPPILLSRAMPIVSNVVAYHCRDLAAAWVPHLSDPYPPFEWREHWYSGAMRPLNFHWARRFLQKSDLLTVTCPNAARYVADKLNATPAERDRLLVVTHLARPLLRPGGFRLPREPGTFVFAHLGNLMARRRPDVLIHGIIRAAARRPGIRLLQYGHVDDAVMRLVPPQHRNLISLQRVDNLSPRDSADLQQQTDANVIVDTDLGLPYSPFILSKYPHCACSGRPMLMITTPDSAMGDFTRRLGGGLCVPFDADAAADACVALYDAARALGPSPLAPSPALMREFSPESIVPPFLDRLQALNVRQ